MKKVGSFFFVIRTFVVDSFKELREKVTWPKYKELQNSSTLVLIASMIFALVIWGIDLVFDQVMGFFYGT